MHKLSIASKNMSYTKSFSKYNCKNISYVWYSNSGNSAICLLRYLMVFLKFVSNDLVNLSILNKFLVSPGILVEAHREIGKHWSLRDLRISKIYLVLRFCSILHFHDPQYPSASSLSRLLTQVYMFP